MNAQQIFKISLALSFALLSSCAIKPDYLNPDLATHQPKTVVILPPENQTSNTNIEEKLFPILGVAFAKRGYYVYSPEMTRAIFNMNKLEDAATINKLPPAKVGEVFGATAILRTRVYDWSSKYIVISSTVNVGLDMELVDCATGKQLWAFKRLLSKAPDGNNNGLLGAMVNAAMNAALTPYEPIAQENSNVMFSTVPAGLDMAKWGIPK
jgi:hypothetical protein